MRLHAVLALLLLVACDRPIARRSLARISAEPGSLDFGSKAPGESATAVVTLTNNGEAALNIESVALRNDARAAFTVTAAPTRIEVGATLELTVTYLAPLVEGVDGASLEIESDADNAPQLLVPLGGRSQSPCPTGQGLCSGSCVALQTDVAHCGSCATVCPAGQVCVAGGCRPCASNDECGAGQACVGGACVACTANAQCNPGQACVSGACGPCAANAQCDADAGQACVNNVCGACAANGECAVGQACVTGRCGQCTSASQCSAGQGCVNGACTACTANGHCGPGQACVSGSCGACTGNAQCAVDAGQVCVNGACGACTFDTECAVGEACFAGACGPCTSDFCTMKGLIVAWSGSLASIPSGWALADGQNGTPDLRGYFLKGASSGMNPGGTGGSLTHDHGGVTGTVSVTTASAGSLTCGVSVGGTSWIANPSVHTHDLVHSHAIPPASHLPQYVELAFIVKQDSLLRPPDGAIIGWSGAGSLDGGWLPLDGTSAVPDMRNRFLRAAGVGQNPGAVGGSATHDHDGGTSTDSRNTTNAAIGNYSFAGNAGAGCGLSGEFGHFHTYPHAHAIAPANHEPPYMLVNWVTASTAAAFPTGAIAMWNGSVVSPPRGWSVCDGTNGTPDLTGRFLKGTGSGGAAGSSGGSTTHAHGGMTVFDDGGTTTLSPNTNSPAGGATAMSVHVHDMPPHGHPLTAASTEPPYYQIVFLIKR